MQNIYVASSESRINNEYKIGKHIGSFAQLWYDLQEKLDSPIICLYIPLQTTEEDYADEVLNRVFNALKYDRTNEGDWVITTILEINKVIGEEINNVEYAKESEKGEINYSELAKITNGINWTK